MNFILSLDRILNSKCHLDLVANFDENVTKRKDFLVEEQPCLLRWQGFVRNIANLALNIGFIEAFVMVYSKLFLENHSCRKHVAGTFFQILVNEIWRDSSLKLCSELEFGNFLAKLNGH